MLFFPLGVKIVSWPCNITNKKSSKKWSGVLLNQLAFSISTLCKLLQSSLNTKGFWKKNLEQEADNKYYWLAFGHLKTL